MSQTNFITIGSIVREGVVEHPGRDDHRLSTWFKTVMRRKVTVRTKTALRQYGPFVVLPYFRLDKNLELNAVDTNRTYYLIYDEASKKFNRLVAA
jgi:hypothetical protein